ncbi:MAG: mannosyltransferase B [Patescibacteria group bacterium]|nr:MAG: mannosyltransferase B [Patescibacteria group bacterium]
MRLGIDARLAFQTGVGVHIRNLLINLQSLLPDAWQVFIFSRPGDIGKLRTIMNTTDNISFIPADAQWHSFSEQTKFLVQLYQTKLDLMHFTYFSYPVLYKKKFIITLHDLIPYDFKTGKASTKNFFIYEAKHRIYKYLIRQAVFNSEHIFTPSRTVANDIVAKFKVKRSKITIVYGGVDKELLEVLNNIEAKSKNYFLYVGNFYPHKNVRFLIDSFLSAKISDKLYLVGPDDFFSAKIKTSYAKEILKGRLVFKHNLSVKQLALLYKQAKALVFPSLAEGFGLPVIEAFSADVPVIASDIKVFKELFGSSIFYFNPKNKNDLANILRTFDKIDNSLVTKKLSKAKKLLTKYSFANLAKKVVNIYKKVI